MGINLHASQHHVRVGRLLYTREEIPELIEALKEWAEDKEGSE